MTVTLLSSSYPNRANTWNHPAMLVKPWPFVFTSWLDTSDKILITGAKMGLEMTTDFLNMRVSWNSKTIQVKKLGKRRDQLTIVEACQVGRVSLLSYITVWSLNFTRSFIVHFRLATHFKFFYLKILRTKISGIIFSSRINL